MEILPRSVSARIESEMQVNSIPITVEAYVYEAVLRRKSTFVAIVSTGSDFSKIQMMDNGEMQTMKHLREGVCKELANMCRIELDSWNTEQCVQIRDSWIGVKLEGTYTKNAARTLNFETGTYVELNGMFEKLPVRKTNLVLECEDVLAELTQRIRQIPLVAPWITISYSHHTENVTKNMGEGKQKTNLLFSYRPSCEIGKENNNNNNNNNAVQRAFRQIFFPPNHHHAFLLNPNHCYKVEVPAKSASDRGGSGVVEGFFTCFKEHFHRTKEFQFVFALDEKVGWCETNFLRGVQSRYDGKKNNSEQRDGGAGVGGGVKLRRFAARMNVECQRLGVNNRFPMFVMFVPKEHQFWGNDLIDSLCEEMFFKVFGNITKHHHSPLSQRRSNRSGNNKKKDGNTTPSSMSFIPPSASKRMNKNNILLKRSQHVTPGNLSYFRAQAATVPCGVNDDSNNDDHDDEALERNNNDDVQNESEEQPIATNSSSASSSYYLLARYLFTINVKQQQKVTLQMLKQVRVVGQLNLEFIIAYSAGEKQIYCIDQHAAHERIRLEALTQSFLHSKSSELIVGPRAIGVSEMEFSHLSNATVRARLEFWGFHYTLLLGGGDGKQEVLVNRAPHIDGRTLTEESCLKTLHELLQNKHFETQIIPQEIQLVLNSRSCRGAIMFGDYQSTADMENILRALCECEFPFQCAHGRLVGGYSMLVHYILTTTLLCYHQSSSDQPFKF